MAADFIAQVTITDAERSNRIEEVEDEGIARH